MANHEVFQGFYYFEHININKNRRDSLKNQPDYSKEAWDTCAYFCENYDAPSFDPEYDNMSLSSFIPMVENIFAKNAYWDDPQNPKNGAVTGND